MTIKTRSGETNDRAPPSLLSRNISMREPTLLEAPKGSLRTDINPPVWIISDHALAPFDGFVLLEPKEMPKFPMMLTSVMTNHSTRRVEGNIRHHLPAQVYWVSYLV